MARKRMTSDSGGASWLETYSDLVTLLLTFFVLLYSMSTIDAQKYSMLVEAFSKGNVVVTDDDLPPGENLLDDGSIEDTPIKETEEADDIDKLYKMITEYVEANQLSESVEVSKSEEYVFIRFSDAITFDGYSNKLKASGIKILDVLAEGLRLVDKYVEEVIIAGHTAEVENDSRKIDRSLSTERANAVLEHLEAKNVINPAKYLAIGYGLYSPIADNSTSAGRAKNRRVEIYISRKGYPVSYTNIIKKTLNGNEKNGNSDNTNDTKNNTEYKSYDYNSIQ